MALALRLRNVTLAVVVALLPSIVWGQAANNGGNGGGNVGNNAGNGSGQLIAGVEIDARGTLRTRTFPDPGGRLMRDRAVAAKVALGEDLVRKSPMRKVSLNRLEAAVAEQLKNGDRATPAMAYLAGITRIQYVFFFPETHDIVVAGPAEGFVADPSGRVVGMSTGQPVLELQDLIVALRMFPPQKVGNRVISVSIDPTPDGLARMQKTLAAAYQTNLRPDDDTRLAVSLRESLGLQNVSIRGVPDRTHFAQVLVEADYRMKLISIGLEIPAARIESYVARATPQSVSRNALERFYFMTNYDEIRVSEDGTAMELVGNGVKLVGENERVNVQGGRAKSGTVNKAAQAFCKQFTDRYAELAARSPIYAQLRNMVDMSVIAAYLQERDIYSQADWRAEVFMDEARLSVETYEVPKQVESAVNVVWKGSTLMTPIGGGVQIQVRDALSPGVIKPAGAEIQQQKSTVKIDDVPNNRWWWD